MNLWANFINMVEEKIPAPPLKNSTIPIELWATIIKMVGYKISEIASVSGFGNVVVTFKVWGGVVSDFNIMDEVHFKRLGKKDKGDLTSKK